MKGPGIILGILLFLAVLTSTAQLEPESVAILPLGPVDEGTLQHVKEGITQLYGLKVVILKQAPLPQEACTPQQQPLSPRT